MIKEHKKLETREVEVIVGLKITCSECEKVIADMIDDGRVGTRGGQGESYPYYSLTTGHHDWGNDSPDSVEIRELCSKECCVKSLTNFLDKNEGSNTAYYELQKCCAYKYRDWKTGRLIIKAD